MKQTHHIEVTLKQLRVTTTIKLDARILDDACVALDSVAAGRQRSAVGPWQVVLGGRFVRVAAVFALIAAVVAVAVVLWVRGAEDTRPIAKPPRPREAPNAPPEIAEVQRQLADEKAQIETMFAAADIDGLVAVLAAGLPESKRLAAAYLGEIGDARALPALSQLAAAWPVSPEQNPYQEAIEQINARMQPPEPNVPDPNQVSHGQVSPEPGQAPVLSGTITDRDTGLPILGVQMQISLSGGGSSHTATTDSNGLYAFETVGIEGAYVVRLTAPEHVTAASWEAPRETIQLRRGGGAVKDYALARGAEILVTVVNEARQPIGRANVFASYVADEGGRGPKRSVRTSANGMVSLGGLRPDEYWITVAHRDYAFAGQSVVLEEPGQVKPAVFILEKGIDVIGLATCSDGLPPAGWRVEAKPKWWHSSRSWPRDEPVGDDGSFALSHIVPGLHHVAVYIPLGDGGWRGIWSTDVNLPPATGLLELQVPKPSPHARVRISGTVRFTGGDYDRGFSVNAFSQAGGHGSEYLDRGEREFALTDLVPGLYDIYTTIEGERHELKNVLAPSEGIVLEIPIGQAVPRRARVVDKQTAQPVTRFAYRVLGQIEWLEIDDPNGAFEVTGRGPDAVQVIVRADGYGDKLAELSGDANEPTLVEMGVPVTLAGTVVDEAGRPVEGATVNYRYRRRRDEPPEGKYVTSTDSEGRFLVGDMPAQKHYHWFVFRHRDFARELKYIQVGDDATEAKIILKTGGAVEGYVYDWQGELMPHTRLYFMDESHFPYWKENRARLGEVTTDESGFYRIEHLPEELCYAYREGAREEPGVVLAGILPRQDQTRRLDIGGPWKVTGRLIKDGGLLANTRLMVHYQAGISQGFEAYAMTDARGAFAFYGLPTGRRRLYWGGNGFRAAADGWLCIGAFDFAEGVDLDLGDCVVAVSEATIGLVPESPDVSMDSWRVRLQAFDADSFWGRDAGLLQPRRAHADPFVFANLGKGLYEAIAQRDDYPSVRQVFEIGPEQKTSTVVLTIPAGSASLSGSVEVRPSGEFPSSLMLRSQDERLTVALQTDADGAFAAENLPAGTYVIGRASVARARTSAVTTFSLEPGEHKEVLVQMDADEAARASDGYLVVLVVTEAGIPLATPDVWLERAGHVIESHFNTDDRKSFRAAPGTYTLHCHYPGFRSARQTVEIRPREGRTVQEILEPLVVTMRRR